MAVTTDLQRKYRYAATIKINSSGNLHTGVPVDEFTPPDRRAEAVTRQNRRLGPVVLTGPVSYGEMTVRLALRVADPNTTASLISDLQAMKDNDADTCDITLSLLAGIDPSEQVSHKQHYSNCKLTGYVIDALSRKGDDDMVHLQMTLMPSRVSRLQGEQLGT